MARKFRKKPVVVEAVQFTGNNLTEIQAFAGAAAVEIEGKLWIGTFEGALVASLNDWIVKGVQGEFYPVKPDIFEATYDAV